MYAVASGKSKPRGLLLWITCKDTLGMSSHSKIKRSREHWKQKASRRGDETRYLRKELRRVKQDRDTYKQRAQQAERQGTARQPPARRRKPDLVLLA